MEDFFFFSVVNAIELYALQLVGSEDTEPLKKRN